MPTPTPAPCLDESALRKFLRDELPAEEASRVDHHLGACPACQRCLDRLIGGLPPGLIATAGAPAAVGEDGPPALPGCETLGPVAEGGMGMVYRAHDRMLDEPVAIKVLRQELAATPAMAERFRSEIKLARKVSHPNVCRILDVVLRVGRTRVALTQRPRRCRVCERSEPAHRCQIRRKSPTNQ